MHLGVFCFLLTLTFESSSKLDVSSVFTVLASRIVLESFVDVAIFTLLMPSNGRIVQIHPFFNKST